MEKAIIGKKVGMTQIFDADGKVIPVTAPFSWATATWPRRSSPSPSWAT